MFDIFCALMYLVGICTTMYGCFLGCVKLDAKIQMWKNGPKGSGGYKF